MRAVIQRVLRASVSVDGVVVGAIEEPGLLVYLGVTHGDGAEEIGWVARKVWEMRVLRDEQSASDVGAPILVVSQFTLYGDARKGRRPRGRRLRPGRPASLSTTPSVRSSRGWAPRVERAVFGADMRVASVNDGPITLTLDKEPATHLKGLDHQDGRDHDQDQEPDPLDREPTSSFDDRIRLPPARRAMSLPRASIPLCLHVYRAKMSSMCHAEGRPRT